MTEDHEISVIVCDVGTGHERCFRVGLSLGNRVPCG
jgi:hypothetical protein